MQDSEKPLVSICCITYNHEPYIRECLEGFMMQQTDFPFEVLIHDDASTDRTTDIIREYEAKYPDIIKPIYQTENQYSRGKSIWGEFQFPFARGKYITLCEGDDFWTDPLKLQIQYDYMETHPDCSICFHYCKTLKNGTLFDNEGVPRLKKNDIRYGEDFIFNTCSVFFRNIDNSQRLIEVFKRGEGKLKCGDYVIFMIMGEFGYFHYIDKAMGVYRIHPGGVTHNGKWNADPTKFFLHYLFLWHEVKLRAAKNKCKYSILYELKQAICRFDFPLLRKQVCIIAIHYGIGEVLYWLLLCPISTFNKYVLNKEIPHPRV